MEDCCAVCAEPLMWVAYGQCGHKEACSKCVTRLRFVMKDNRCVICQQQLLAVFVTRFMGDYTKALGPAEFEQLQVRLFASDVLTIARRTPILACQPAVAALHGLLFCQGPASHSDSASGTTGRRKTGGRPFPQSC